MLHAGGPDVVKRYVNSGPASGADLKNVDQYHGEHGCSELLSNADSASCKSAGSTLILQRILCVFGENCSGTT